MTSKRIDEITAEVAKNFNGFGKGTGKPSGLNPLERWLDDKPPTFALGVDMREVVKFVVFLVVGAREK